MGDDEYIPKSLLKRDLDLLCCHVCLRLPCECYTRKRNVLKEVVRDVASGAVLAATAGAVSGALAVAMVWIISTWAGWV